MTAVNTFIASIRPIVVSGVTVDPGCRALLSTAAMLVNGIPHAIAAQPGVHRPGDLPPSAPWLGDEPPAWVPLRS